MDTTSSSEDSSNDVTPREDITESPLSAYLTTKSTSNTEMVDETLKDDKRSSQLIDKFEEDGILRDVRCILNSKLVTEISGVEEGLPLVPRRRHGIGGEGERDIRLQILDALILEVLQWEGFKHTADMFIRESGTELKDPPRDLFETMLGPIQEKNKPFLLQLIKKRDT